MAGAPEKVQDVDILRLVAMNSHPVTSSGEVADRLPVVQKTVEKRLAELFKKGLVDRKKVGRAYAWWITPAGEDFLVESETEWHK